MLYELVTGKPPFQADDPTAVISQHIHTPPVAPSYQSAHCPPDLETLILQLLSKSPADRPRGAADVREALSRVDPNAHSASHSDSQVNPLDRLARGVFVGRERELERLRAAFDDAFAGRGSVVMLVGEPGIGKTRTTMELETYARMRGAQVYWGRADESAGAPPYRPWRQIAQSYRSQNPDDLRRQEWGEHAVELQRIFPALRDLFPGLPPLPETESDEGRYRLFEAMAGFLSGVSERLPLMVVLDDLHWADHATLQMLTHIAREIARSRILVLGTYRDTELDRTHPLSQTLAELNRGQLFMRILLRGLDRSEVGAYISAAAQVQATPALVARIHEETEGNPFFVSEVVNLMAQEGILTRVANTSLSDIAIPEGVKEALGRRLDRLSPEANELVQLASVIGREFDHTLLLALTGGEDEKVLHLEEEALAARVIEEFGPVGGYRFTHALMQETLVGELSAARQVRLHGQIAEAMEQQLGTRADANAAALSAHYAESAMLRSELCVGRGGSAVRTRGRAHGRVRRDHLRRGPR
jgi:predicted ATPase